MRGYKDKRETVTRFHSKVNFKVYAFTLASWVKILKAVTTQKEVLGGKE
jgi:hypothetical protein